MTTSTKWTVAIFVVVAAFAAGMLLTENVEVNPRDILASFDGLPEGDTAGTTSTQLTLPEAGQGAAGVPKPVPQAQERLRSALRSKRDGVVHAPHGSHGLEFS